jgi:hypothetical protein
MSRVGSFGENPAVFSLSGVRARNGGLKIIAFVL